MGKIKNIIFDYDNVLGDVHLSHIEYFKTVPGHENFRREDIPKVLQNHNGAWCEVPPEHRKSFEASPHRFKRPLMPGVADALKKFRDAGIRRFVLTATSDPDDKRRALEKYIGDLAEFSCSCRANKSDGIRAIILENNLDPGETVFIDDLFHYIRQALEIPGLRAVRFQPEFYSELPDDLAGRIPAVKNMDEFFNLITNGELI